MIITFGCVSKQSLIDKKVSKTEKSINKNTLLKENLCFNCVTRLDTIIGYYKIENQLKKITFNINSKENCKKYNKKGEIYLENNIPYFINEFTNGVCEDEISGMNHKTNKFQHSTIKNKIETKFKIYVLDWNNFNIDVKGSNQFEYNFKTKKNYQKIIDSVILNDSLINTEQSNDTILSNNNFKLNEDFDFLIGNWKEIEFHGNNGANDYINKIENGQILSFEKDGTATLIKNNKKYEGKYVVLNHNKNYYKLQIIATDNEFYYLFAKLKDNKLTLTPVNSNFEFICKEGCVSIFEKVN